MKFENKIAFVSGGAEGMGFAIAQAFARAGAAVALTDTDEEATAFAVEQLAQQGHRTLGIACDLTDEASVADAVDRTVTEFGRLDMAYNDAGLDILRAENDEASEADFDHTIAINLKSVWLCMKHQLRRMREQGSGAIVNCTSSSGITGIAGSGAYAAAKHGVVGLTRAAALEYARKGIRINAICSDTDTVKAAVAMRSDPERVKAVNDDNPLSRIGTPEETVLWLCSASARFMIGQIVAPLAPARRGDSSGRTQVRADIFKGPYPPSRT